MPGRVALQAFVGKRRAGDIAAQLLEAFSVLGVAAHGCEPRLLARAATQQRVRATGQQPHQVPDGAPATMSAPHRADHAAPISRGGLGEVELIGGWAELALDDDLAELIEAPGYQVWAPARPSLTCWPATYI